MVLLKQLVLAGQASTDRQYLQQGYSAYKDCDAVATIVLWSKHGFC